MTDSFRPIYTINEGIPQDEGVAVGRYPEDVYYGGNAWYLSTFAAAEQLYDAVYQWKQVGSITITSTSLSFFQALYSSATVGSYPSSSAEFEALINAVSIYADSYMSNAVSFVLSIIRDCSCLTCIIAKIHSSKRWTRRGIFA